MRSLSISYALLALIGLTELSTSPSCALPAGQAGTVSRATILIPIVDVCRTYTAGNEEITLYCEDGLSCGKDESGNTKCFADVDAMSGQDSNGEGGEGVEEFEHFNNQKVASEPKKKESSRGGLDCESAGEFERLTAGWYEACVINNVPVLHSSYKPKIDPAELSRNAKQRCQGSSEFDQCVASAKQDMILAADPTIRDACSMKSGVRFVECVDTRYVYGPINPSDLERAHVLRELLRARERAQRDKGPPDQSKLDTIPKTKGCPPGYGVKPDRDAFGAWTCQPLGAFFFGNGRRLPPGQKQPAADEVSKAIDAFEERLDDIVQDAAESALGEEGKSLSETERQKCADEAFEAVHSIVKGGPPEVSSSCRTIVAAARAAFTYYVFARIDNSNAGIEELLSNLRPSEQPVTPDSRKEDQPAPGNDQVSSQGRRTDPASKAATEDCAWFCENAHSVVCDEENRIDLSLSGGAIEEGIQKYGCKVAP
jgi:hypothetical protein